LPCIIKTRGKIKIEQENGEIIEFDEDAVEMLNLIASNRGQREERTVDEKLQEVKYLETFAKAIYHQKNRGSRGRFRNFFAEEILNMSKSQLQRISAMEKLTDKVKAAVDDKKISESAALAMSNMTAEEQDACLEKIMSGEIRGTAQDIQNLSASKVVEEVEEDTLPKNADSDLETSSDESAVEENSEESVLEEVTSEAELVSEDVPAKSETEEEVETGHETGQSPKVTISLENETSQSRGFIISELIDVPEKLELLRKEAEEWFYRENLALEEELYKMQLEVYKSIYDKAKKISEEEDGLESAQWAMRASVARYALEELKEQHKQSK